MNVDSASAGPWLLKSLSVTTATDQPARATVVLIDEDGGEHEGAASGDGPVAAAIQAIGQVTGMSLTLKKFELHSVSTGEDAQGEVTVTVERDGSSYRGHGTSVDIVEAGSRACLEVMNRLLRKDRRGGATAGKPVDRASI
jgi:2-isopropylmalate synthase